MNAVERRAKRRLRVEGAVDLIWKDESGQRLFESGRIVDMSEEGMAIESPQPIAAPCSVILQAPAYGIAALSQVRHCSWRRSLYQFGVQLLGKASESTEPDLRELVQAGIAGDAERLDRLYRALAFRYHPDNCETGDAETFLRIREVYQILSVTRRRQDDFSERKPLEDLDQQKGHRLAVLRLLYQRRARDYQNAAVSLYDISAATALGVDQIGFILWYLREKGAVTADETTNFAISASGVDLLEGSGVAGWGNRRL